MIGADLAALRALKDLLAYEDLQTESLSLDFGIQEKPELEARLFF